MGASELYCNFVSWDDFGADPYHNSIRRGTTRKTYVVCLVTNVDPSKLGHQEAVIVMETERLNEFFRVGIVRYRLLSYKIEIDAWRAANTGSMYYCSPERVQAYHEKLISILEAETPIITLV